MKKTSMKQTEKTAIPPTTFENIGFKNQRGCGSWRGIWFTEIGNSIGDDLNPKIDPTKYNNISITTTRKIKSKKDLNESSADESQILNIWLAIK